MGLDGYVYVASLDLEKLVMPTMSTVLICPCMENGNLPYEGKKNYVERERVQEVHAFWEENGKEHGRG